MSHNGNRQVETYGCNGQVSILLVNNELEKLNGYLVHNHLLFEVALWYCGRGWLFHNITLAYFPCPQSRPLSCSSWSLWNFSFLLHMSRASCNPSKTPLHYHVTNLYFPYCGVKQCTGTGNYLRRNLKSCRLIALETSTYRLELELGTQLTLCNLTQQLHHRRGLNLWVKMRLT